MIRFLFEFDAFCGPRRFNYAVGMPRAKPSKNTPMPLDLTIDTTQEIPVTLKPVDTTGAPIALKTPPKWTVTAGIATVVPATDGLSALLVSSDTPGDSIITISEDGSSVTDTITLHVDQFVPPAPVLASFGLTAGTAIPKPTVTTPPVPTPAPAPVAPAVTAAKAAVKVGE